MCVPAIKIEHYVLMLFSLIVNAFGMSVSHPITCFGPDVSDEHEKEESSNPLIPDQKSKRQ